MTVPAAGPPTNFEYTAAFSVAMWVWLDNTTEKTMVGCLDPAASFKGWEVQYSFASGQRFNFHLINTYPSKRIMQSSFNAPTLNVWNHLGVTYNGSGVAAGTKVYVNAALETSNAAADTLAASTMVNTTPLQFGRRSDASDPFAGRMRDLAIWRGELTAPEMAMLGRGNIQPPGIRPQSLISYYPFNDAGRAQRDLGIFGRTGNLRGALLIADPPLLNAYGNKKVSLMPNIGLAKRAAAAAFISGWSRQSNLPVIGGGTF